MFPNDLSYDERGYDIYVNGVLICLAYKRKDARKAKEYAHKMINLGDKSIKTKLSMWWFGFWVFLVIKKLKIKK